MKKGSSPISPPSVAGYCGGWTNLEMIPNILFYPIPPGQDLRRDFAIV